MSETLDSSSPQTYCGDSRRWHRQGSDPRGRESVAGGRGCRRPRNRADEFDWGADRYLRDGVTLPADAVEMFQRDFDAMLLGAMGDPRVPTNVHAADILLGLRFKLDLYVNARPVRAFRQTLTPLKDRAEKDVNFIVFRENTEGLYVQMGGNFKKGTADEIAMQEDLNTRKGVERIIRYAFDFARRRGLHARLHERQIKRADFWARSVAARV